MSYLYKKGYNFVTGLRNKETLISNEIKFFVK